MTYTLTFNPNAYTDCGNTLIKVITDTKVDEKTNLIINIHWHVTILRIVKEHSRTSCSMRILKETPQLEGGQLVRPPLLGVTRTLMV